MRQVSSRRASVPWKENFEVWLQDAETRLAAGGKTSVAEYTAVAHLERSGEASLFSAQTRALIQSLRERTFVQLTGRPPRPGEWRLPYEVVAKEPIDLRQLHNIAFARRDGFLSSAHDAIDNYEPRTRDLLSPASWVLLYAAAGPAALFGYAAGHVYGGLMEHFIHDVVGHSTEQEIKEMEPKFARFGAPGRRVYEGIVAFWEIHNLHHRIYARDYAAPVDEATATEWREELSPLGQKSARSSEDGLRPNMMSDLPIHLTVATASFGIGIGALYAASKVLGFDPGGAQLVLGGAVAALKGGSWPLASEFIHRYLHRPQTEHQAAGPVARFQLGSRKAASISLSHAVHHKKVKTNLGLSTHTGDTLRGTDEPVTVEAYLSLMEKEQLRFVEPDPWLHRAWAGLRAAISRTTANAAPTPQDSNAL